MYQNILIDHFMVHLGIHLMTVDLGVFITCIFKSFSRKIFNVLVFTGLCKADES